MNKRIISFLLLFVLIFNLLTPYTVFGADDEDTSATAVQADFLNFWSGGVTGLSMENTTSTDYYVLSAFMSNFYNPGSTTLSEIINPDESNTGFYQSFAKSLGKSGDSSLQAIVKTIGEDTVKGIESGKCTLVGSDSKGITGEDFVTAILSSISNTNIDKGGYDYNKGELKSSAVYYQSSSNLAFDFSSPAVRGAFQVLCSYCPELFFSQKGLFSLERLFIDNVGNVWGVDDVNDVIQNDNFSGMISQIGPENIYLILPACLNPSTFSPKVDKNSTDSLRLPLMNRFTLGAIIKDESSIGTNFTQEYIPYYNLLASSLGGNNQFSIFGLHSVSPNTMALGKLFNASLPEWGNKAQDLAFFAYDPSFMAISLQNSSSGISKFATNSFIVLSPSFNKLVSISGTNASGDGNMTLDLKELIAGAAFDIYGSNAEALKKQRQLLLYMYSGNALTLNQTSMQLFLHSGLANSGKDVSGEFAEDLYGSEVDKVAAEVGMMGLSLFFENAGTSHEFSDGEKYRGLNPDNIISSMFINELGYGTKSIDAYKAVQSNDSSRVTSVIANERFLNLINSALFNQKFDITKWNNTLPEIDAVTGLSKTENTLLSNSTKIIDSYIDYYDLYINPQGFLNAGNNNKDITLGRTSSIKDYSLLQKIDELDNEVNDPNKYSKLKVSLPAVKTAEALMTLYGYSVFLPSPAVTNELSNQSNLGDMPLLGSGKTFKPGISLYNMSNGDFLMSMYFGYIMDMMGFSNLTPASDSSAGSVTFRDFSSPFLPKYDIGAKGGTLGMNDGNGLLSSGVESSENDDFEKMQKDLVKRIYGLTEADNNDYRNELIKNILEGFLLTIHRTVTGTWSQDIGTITSGDSSTYQSVTGYIYTPTLEELSFTATLMNNYVKIYIICLIIVIFLMVLMVLLHMRTWQQGLFISLVMCVALLFPYILISNSINISNKISNSVYSDRFDFWALTQQQQSLRMLNSTAGLSEKDVLLTLSSATADRTYAGSTGVKIKWMSPKKAEVFNTLYSDKSLSQSFVTNIDIYKWLFTSFVYDSEFVDTDIYGSYLYRPYNSIGAEAKAYYAWGQLLVDNGTLQGSNSTTIEGHTFTGLPKGYVEGLNVYDTVSDDVLYGGKVKHLAGAIRGNRSNLSYYDSPNANLHFTPERLEDFNKISAMDKTGADEMADIIGMWGSLDEQILSRMLDEIVAGSTAGIESNLSTTESEDDFDSSSNYKDISRAIYLKNTESPFYYFYSVLRMRYDENSEDGSFRKQLLENDMFKISRAESEGLNNQKNVRGMYRDYLDLEGLFTYVIPYLKEGNDYVTRWQAVNGSEIDEYNFKYDENGNPLALESEGDTSAYMEAAKRKVDMNHVWNMYAPWVDSLYELDIYNERVTVGGKKLIIADTLNPSYYIKAGRPMIFSEADMTVKGYSYKDLTDVERRIQAVLEKTYTDMLYLVNYYDLDNEVLITAAAMYATFHFNEEFSQDSFIGKSVMLYPQCFELKNFNYDAYMRLALLNSTGETVYASDDLYTRVLSKCSIFTGLLLLVCDVIACIAIPMFKFLIIIGLVFLGILICIACVVNPPDKIFEAVNKSLLLPTVLFMALNIGFAWLTSFIVGEGLTAYVGSKSVNFATNDPTVTLLLIALLGGAYLFCAWKILKFLVEAYRQFGVSTALAAVGVVGSALAAGTAGVAKKGLKLLDDTGSGILGMGVGAVTAGRGNRLAGAYEGARRGTRGILDQRIREQRTRRDLGGLALSDSKAVTNSIDAKASNAKGDETSINSKSSYNNDYQNLLNEERKAGVESESTLISSGVNKLNKFRHKAVNAFSAIGSGVNTVAFTATHLPDVVGTGFRKGYNAVENYVGKSIKDIQHDNQRLESINKYRKAQRNYDRFEFKKGLVSSEKSKRDIIEEERFNTSTKVRYIKVSALKNEYEDLSPVLRNAAVNADAYNALNSRPVIRMTGVVDKGKKEG